MKWEWTLEPKEERKVDVIAIQTLTYNLQWESGYLTIIKKYSVSVGIYIPGACILMLLLLIQSSHKSLFGIRIFSYTLYIQPGCQFTPKWKCAGHLRCRGVSFFHLKRFEVAHQWILCSELLPSEWDFKQHNNPQVIHTTPVHQLLFCAFL